jgi:putative ABC transport system permease protein
MRRLISLFTNLRRRRDVESEIDDELRFHVEMETEAHRARGLPIEEARRNALRDLGGVTQTREAVREVRMRWMDTMRQDVRFAFRRWRHRPGFTAAAIFTVALGIAAVTSIFAVVDAVLLRPLPWEKPESLVIVHGVFPDRRNDPATAPTWNRWYLSLDAWDALSAASSFEAVGVWHAAWVSDTIVGDRRDELVPALNVSSKLLPMLGVKLQRGRFFNDSEDHSRTDSVIVTDEFWRRRFGGSEDIIGKQIALGQARYSGESVSKTVVGVIATGFQFGGIRAEIVRPIGESRWQRDSADLRMVARLAPSVSLTQANAQAAALVSASPIDQQAASARLVSIEDEQLGSSRRPLWMLFGGAGILLLVACSNVAGLLLGEARIRRHEFGVRAAIGGSRGRIVRQLLVEHGLLAITGAAAGLIAARWLTRLVVAVAPAGMPRIEATVIDLRTAAFAVAAGVVTLLVFGVAPALAFARAPVAGMLGWGTRDIGASKVTGQRLVVAAQVALALVLLTGATLFGETMIRLRALPLGFHPDGVAVISTTFTGSLYGDPATTTVTAHSSSEVYPWGRSCNPRGA